MSLEEWNYNWENGSEAGRMEVYLGKRNYRWEK